MHIRRLAGLDSAAIILQSIYLNVDSPLGGMSNLLEMKAVKGRGRKMLPPPIDINLSSRYSRVNYVMSVGNENVVP
jgi:hypothetical protein